MNFFAFEWLNFLVRWAHLIAGISWIGSSFYFMWLDSSLEEPEDRSVLEGELWMVHSGGFYHVQRKKIGPGSMPKNLHWFKFEALLTWMTGLFLLGIVYYAGNAAFLIDPNVAKISPFSAILLSLSLLGVSWIVYDGLWISIGKKFPRLTTLICLFLTGGLAFALCKAFSGRGAFLHLGAIFGTIMVANVWMRILPAQQKMIDATKEGRAPDFANSGYAKRRSVHNSYMTFPVIFAMLSNHYSMAYGHPLNWAVLILLVIFGITLRHVMLAKNDKEKIWSAAATLAAGAAMMFLVADPGQKAVAAEGAPVSFGEVRNVIESRCIACHSQNPVDNTFGPSPGGVHFEDPTRIQALASRILERAVITKTMPFNNKTGMTEEERDMLARWIHQGAHIEQ